MTKTIKTTQELINYAQQYRIKTDGKLIQNIVQELIDKLMANYDDQYLNIDDGHQRAEAESRNEEIKTNVRIIKEFLYAYNGQDYCVIEGSDDPMDEACVTFVGTYKQCQEYMEDNPCHYDEWAIIESSLKDEETEEMVTSHLKYAEILLKAYGRNQYTIMKEKETMVQEKTNVNNTQEGTTMKTTRDYTLGGILSARTLKDFKHSINRTLGIKCGKKTFEELEAEAYEVIRNYDPQWYVLVSEYGVYCKVDTKQEASEVKDSIHSTTKTSITIWTPVEFGINNRHLEFIENLTLITKDEMVNKFTFKEETTMNANVHAQDYKTKDMIRKELEFNGIILTNAQFKKIKRDDLLAMLEPMDEKKDESSLRSPLIVPEDNKEDIKEEETMETVNNTTEAPVIPVTPAPETLVTPVEPANNVTYKSKSEYLYALIKEVAEANRKKGFGYTISTYMLHAMILKAGAGVNKLKGHKVTDEEKAMDKKIFDSLKDKGYIKPVVYSVKENEKVRVFMPEYTGKLNDTTVKMIPYDKSSGYNAKAVTSYMVTI